MRQKFFLSVDSWEEFPAPLMHILKTSDLLVLFILVTHELDKIATLTGFYTISFITQQ